MTEDDKPKNHSETTPEKQRRSLNLRGLMFRRNRAPAAIQDDMEPPTPRYRPGTIEHCNMPKGGRDLLAYEHELMFDRNDLSGQRVLDLGAGPEVKFARGLAGAGINAEVTSLSADFYNQAHLNRARQFHPDRLVAGLAQELPFEDESFDTILALHVFEHFMSPDNLKAAVREITRVLAKGGTARMGSFTMKSQAYDLIMEDKELTNYLASQGVNVEDVATPEDIIPKQKVYDQVHGYAIPGLLVQPSTLVLTKAPQNVPAVANH